MVDELIFFRLKPLVEHWASFIKIKSSCLTTRIPIHLSAPTDFNNQKIKTNAKNAINNKNEAGLLLSRVNLTRAIFNIQNMNTKQSKNCLLSSRRNALKLRYSCNWVLKTNTLSLSRFAKKIMKASVQANMKKKMNSRGRGREKRKKNYTYAIWKL